MNTLENPAFPIDNIWTCYLLTPVRLTSPSCPSDVRFQMTGFWSWAIREPVISAVQSSFIKLQKFKWQVHKYKI